MNPRKHDEAVEEIRQGLSRLRGVRSVVLFGSAASGSATEESDIDILVDCDAAVTDAVREILYGIGARHEVNVSPAFYGEEESEKLDTQFMESILRHGKPLVGELPRLSPHDLDLQPLRLVSYQIDRLSPRKKAQLLRILDGYQTEKTIRRKRYATQKDGFVRRVGGWRAGRGAVVVPEETIRELDAILEQFGATRTMIPIWCQRP